MPAIVDAKGNNIEVKAIMSIKRIFYTFVSTVLIAAIPVMSVSAQDQDNDSGEDGGPAPVVVVGKVTYNGHAVKGASVTVTCGSTTLTATTNKHGHYWVKFPGNECANGDSVTASAMSGNESGMKSGKVKHHFLRLNIPLMSVAVPEYGFMTATGASLLGAGAFMAIRKRNLKKTATLA